MDRILFSLPVHERPDMVRDLLENIRHFCPGAAVCIHVSAGAVADKPLFDQACDLPGVIVNPFSYATVYGRGLLHTHVSNFEHAVAAGVPFDKIVLISSNEMFVRHGLEDYVSRYAFGAQTEIFDSAADWHLFRPALLQDSRMQGFLGALGLPIYFGGQAEGQFFDRDTFGLISRLYTQFFEMGPAGFESEEVIPATVAARLAMGGRSAGLPVTLCDYCTITQVSEELVTSIRRGEGSLYTVKRPRTLRSPHFGSSVLKSVFSVKRVPRTQCDLRTFIRNLENPAAVA